jgi:hypothetical protein
MIYEKRDKGKKYLFDKKVDRAVENGRKIDYYYTIMDDGKEYTVIINEEKAKEKGNHLLAFLDIYKSESYKA